jgi:hypothetical protein
MRALVAGLALLATAPAFAQTTPAIPRAPAGHPDFTGNWATRIMTPMERPDGVADLVVPHDKEAEMIEKIRPKIGEVFDPEFSYAGFTDNLLEINGELRSSLIVEPADGRLPLTSLAKAILDNYKASFDDPELRPANERCIGGMVQAPIGATSFVIPFQMMQTPQHVVIAAEDMEPVRVIALTGAAPPDAMRSRTGYSHGHWDGDTLVVETDHFGFPDHEGMIFHGETPVTADSRVIERFRLLSTNEMLYQFTIEDPSLYKTPWLAEYTLQRTPRGIYEYACHEGNHAIIGILTAARMGRQEEKPKAPDPASSASAPKP